jgi:hypothetical protein
MKGKFRAIWRVSFVLVLALSVGLVMAPSGEVGAATQEFTTSGTFNFTVPAGVTQITIEAWGGGGAGGGSTAIVDCEGSGGAGGGGGAYASSIRSVTPGQILQVVVGVGGTGVCGANGTAGGPSFVGPDTNPVNAYVRAAGGSGGTASIAVGSPPGGVGGTTAASVGSTRYAGTDGGAGAAGALICSGAGGAGASPGGGSGGAGLCGTVPDEMNRNGNPGNAPGGGGGGGRTSGLGVCRPGGAGAAGKVVITYAAPATYNLTTSSTTCGNVTTPGEGTFAYAAGAVVNLVATADACCRFVNWSAPAGTFGNTTAAVTTFTMPAQDVTVIANFTAVSGYNLTTSSTACCNVTTPGEGIFTYCSGTVVNLVATVDAGCQFVNWSASAGTFANANAAVTTFTMPAQNVTVIANCMAVSYYQLCTFSTFGGNVTTPGLGAFNYAAGTVVSLLATPATGYRFVNWTCSVGATIANVNAASTTITMNGNYSIQANFEEVPGYDLTISSTTGGNVTTPGQGTFTYDVGKVVNLVAAPASGYKFVNWTGNVTTITNVNAASTTITMNGNYAITANFEVAPPSVTTQAASAVNTTSVTLNMNYTVGNFSQVQVCFAYKKSTDSAWSSTDWVSKTADGTYAAPLTGLTSSTQYSFKAQLKYDSTVIEGTTLQFTTATPTSTGWCFIATAAYGTPTARQIDVLREFRDVVLLESAAGSQFVALYYRLSPPIADFIARSGLLRTLVRELLVDPVVWVVEATGAVWRN